MRPPDEKRSHLIRNHLAEWDHRKNPKDSLRKMFDSGTVTTKHGIVHVYAQEDPDTGLTFSRISMVKNQKFHTWSWEGKRYSRQALITLAKRFARELA